MSWVQSDPYPGGYLYGCCRSPELELFAVLASDEFGDGRLATSPDGETWTDRGILWPGSNGTAACWSPDLGLFVALGSSSGSATCIYTSPDGETWTDQGNPFDVGGYGYGTAVCWSPALGIFVALGTAADGSVAVVTSPDGETWTVQDNPWDLGGGGNGFAIAWSPVLELFVALGSIFGDSRVLATSPDGETWTLQSDLDGIYPGGVCWCPATEEFLVTGSDGPGTTIGWTSPDGATWTGVDNPLTNDPAFGTCAAAGDVLELICGYNTDLSVSAASSYDGVVWGALGLPIQYVNGACFASDLSLFLVVGSGDPGAQAAIGDAVFTPPPPPPPLPPAWVFVLLGDPLKIEDVLAHGGALTAGLGRDPLRGDVRFAWVENGGPYSPRIAQFSGAEWDPIGSGDPAADDPAFEDSTYTAEAVFDVLGDVLAWLTDSHGVAVAAFDEETGLWAPLGDPQPPLDAYAHTHYEYLSCVDVAGRANIFVGNSPDLPFNGDPGIYRWNPDTEAWELQGDPFPGYFPHDGDNTVQPNASLVPHADDPDRFAVVLVGNLEDGTSDDSVGVAVWWYDDGTWAYGAGTDADDGDLYPNGDTPNNGSRMDVRACQAGSTVYAVATYANGLGDGWASLAAFSIAWGDSTWAPFPSAGNNVPASDDPDDGYTMSTDGSALAEIAATEDTVAVYIGAQVNADSFRDSMIVARTTTDGTTRWRVEEPTGIEGAALGTMQSAPIMRGRYFEAREDGFVLAYPFYDPDEFVTSWRVYDYSLTGEGGDLLGDGIAVAFVNDTHDLEQDWTRLDDPDA